ncbi:hypothetical protein, variant [Verruconis gallopava]|nr:hypothetical protein, variant [Verruconis gallopava]KIW03279.1 hypothetical protein, variant [Verruconis gallopava]
MDDETIISWREFIPPAQRGRGDGMLADAIYFARYRYRWGQEDFLLYTIQIGLSNVQYVLKEPRGGEKIQGHSRVTDALIFAVGRWMSTEPDALYVFDRYWFKSSEMWKEVQKASWDKVILDPKMKKDLVGVCDTFFDSEKTYKEYGVPWKRGLIFYGPPGNGKTISIKALMHSMYTRKSKVPCLYVKSAPATYMLANVFAMARSEAPCLLVFEDIDTIVTPATRAYFFNEVDGMSNNDGIMMIASTNYLDKLDPGLTKRPSRFDRKYLFPIPSRDERVLYARFWQAKMRGKPIEFPDELCPAVADITDGFSFAYLQELFIASLLQLLRGDSDGPEDRPDKGEGDELDKYELWRALKRQAEILRGGGDDNGLSQLGDR